MAGLSRIVGDAAVDKEIALVLIRAGERKTLRVRIGELADNQLAARWSREPRR